MYDCFGDVDRVPELLWRVERGDDGEAWDELGHRLPLSAAPSGSRHSTMSQVTRVRSVAAVRPSPRTTRSVSASAVAAPTGSSGCGRATTRTWCGP